MAKRTTSISLSDEMMGWIKEGIDKGTFASISHACNAALIAYRSNGNSLGIDVSGITIIGPNIREDYDEEDEHERVAAERFVKEGISRLRELQNKDDEDEE